jgi:hypothetical protein
VLPPCLLCCCREERAKARALKDKFKGASREDLLAATTGGYSGGGRASGVAGPAGGTAGGGAQRGGTGGAGIHSPSHSGGRGRGPAEDGGHMGGDEELTGVARPARVGGLAAVSAAAPAVALLNCCRLPGPALLEQSPPLTHFPLCCCRGMARWRAPPPPTQWQPRSSASTACARRAS